MEIVFFLPLLLVCSVSADQTETPLQPPCPQDIHAVLREMTASLAEHKVEIRTLKEHNKELVAKLKEAESQKLKQQLQDHAAKLEELETHKSVVVELKQELKVKQVAFSASLLDQGDGYTGPFNTETTLIFKRVVTNIGNAYNINTGIFTAPVRGVYHFEWHIGAHGDASHAVYALLFKNGERIFTAYEVQPSHYVTTSNGASLLLEVGDQVLLHLATNSKIYDNQNHLSTFSGHLIFTM
ncbi:complement C1q-like protein 4 [Oreochromis niloticus]|uniref:Complement C1q-like protein 4 n=1 Tax=Oreochromis niloticus TaxID=8128 RepID=I3IUY9_ORENI|nr:complement C1q-like protein 4 [Oreochromis niloticus]